VRDQLGVDGGALVRAAMDAGLVDRITLTLVPIVLGRGISLFTGLASLQRLELVAHQVYPGGAVQLTYVPARP
jgi:dihydrofolate reductase